MHDTTPTGSLLIMLVPAPKNSLELIPSKALEALAKNLILSIPKGIGISTHLYWFALIDTSMHYRCSSVQSAAPRVLLERISVAVAVQNLISSSFDTIFHSNSCILFALRVVVIHDPQLDLFMETHGLQWLKYT